MNAVNSNVPSGDNFCSGEFSLLEQESHEVIVLPKIKIKLILILTCFENRTLISKQRGYLFGSTILLIKEAYRPFFIANCLRFSLVF